MVSAIVDHHVRPLGHVAVRAKTSLASGLVEVVLRLVVDVGSMAPRAKGVAFRPRLATMRIVAIAADDASGVHLALQERAVDVDFILDLPIVEVEELIEHRQTIPIVIAVEIAAEVGATGVAGSTHLGLVAPSRLQHGDVAPFLEHPYSV